MLTIRSIAYIQANALLLLVGEHRPIKGVVDTCEDKKGKKAQAPPKAKVPVHPLVTDAKEKDKGKEKPEVPDAKTEGVRFFHVFRGLGSRSS